MQAPHLLVYIMLPAMDKNWWRQKQVPHLLASSLSAFFLVRIFRMRDRGDMRRMPCTTLATS